MKYPASHDMHDRWYSGNAYRVLLACSRDYLVVQFRTSAGQGQSSHPHASHLILEFDGELFTLKASLKCPSIASIWP